MASLRYLGRVASGMRLGKLKWALGYAHDNSGKSKAWLAWDMARCAVLYGAGYYDYVIFGFWGLSHAKRKGILTRLANAKLIKMVDDDAYHQFFDEKAKFYPKFAKYLGRDVLILAEAGPEGFAAFFRRHQTIIVKPNVGWSGKGIRKLSIEDYPTDEAVSALYDELVASGIGVADELIVQHEALARLNPTSVNSLRVATFVNGDGRPELIYGVIKMGGVGAFVDNQESGGMHCPLDPATGRILSIAHTSDHTVYDHHPATGVALVGYVVPMVPEAFALCLEAALVVPQIRYVGWDVAITESGPVLIEGNNYPGTDFWQLPEYGDLEFGLRTWFAERVPGF